MANPSMGSWFQSKMDKITEIIHETAEEAAALGRHRVTSLVESRGTEKSGKDGRIETGRMRDAVDGRVTDKTSASATAEFGWIEGLPNYTKYQEFGFAHVGGVDVEGMYALHDAKGDVMKNVEKTVRGKIRGL